MSMLVHLRFIPRYAWRLPPAAYRSAAILMKFAARKLDDTSSGFISGREASAMLFSLCAQTGNSYANYFEGKIVDIKHLEKIDLLTTFGVNLISQTVGIVTFCRDGEVQMRQKRSTWICPNATAWFATIAMGLRRLCRPFGEVQQDLFLSRLTIGKPDCLLEIF